MYTFEWKQSVRSINITDESGAQLTKTIEPKFEGSVILKVPKHVDRIKAIRSIHTNVDSNGEMTKSGIDSAEKLIDFAKAHIESVNLKRIEDGVEAKTIDWLEYDVDGSEVLSEIATILLQGIRLGKT